MADVTLVKAMRRFLSRSEIEEAYRTALTAYQERATEVVITQASFEGGNTNGQIVGDPAELMAACEAVLSELDGQKTPSSSTVYHDFSTRRVGT